MALVRREEVSGIAKHKRPINEKATSAKLKSPPRLTPETSVTGFGRAPQKRRRLDTPVLPAGRRPAGTPRAPARTTTPGTRRAAATLLRVRRPVDTTGWSSMHRTHPRLPRSVLPRVATQKRP